MAPICPHMLLRALGPLLSIHGGIKSKNEVQRLSSLMRKFSKKLVSRAVYCEVLRATEPEILGEFLDANGWDTLNKWIQDAHKEENASFLSELMLLFRILPMTVDRLKQNNTAKLIKSLTKSNDNETRILATEIVQNWMSLIKGEKAEEQKNKKKKKERSNSDDSNDKFNNEIHTEIKMEVYNGTTEKDAKGISSSEEEEDKKNKENDHTIVPAIPEANEVSPKRPPKPDRPKTVKTYQGKFRSTGLEEATPLPRPKKVVPSEKTLPPKPLLKRAPSLTDVLIPEKKGKPSNLISNSMTTINKPQPPGGIKLIPPKPNKPLHVLHESASFMDALTAVPTPVIRRKKRPSGPKSPSQPSPPPATSPPKLQFYKDTLEMKEEPMEVKDEIKEEPKEEAEADTKVENEPSDKEPKIEIKEEKELEDGPESPKPPIIPGQPQSILSHCKRRRHKKSVQWCEETQLVQIRFFELDETERVNVNKLHQNFVDLKTLEMRKERMAFENARRMLGDKMEEAIPWREPPIIDLPPPLVMPGCNSTERKVQSLHQQATLQEIYFSKETLPDSPYEPEPEMIAPQEPILIPLDDVTNPGVIVDYSAIDHIHPAKSNNPTSQTTSLPPVLTNLVNSIVKPLPPNHLIPPPVPPPIIMDANTPPPPPLVPDNFINQNLLGADTPRVPPPMGPNIIDRPPPPIFDHPPPPIFSKNEPSGTWCSLEGPPPPPPNNMYHLPLPHAASGLRGGPPGPPRNIMGVPPIPQQWQPQQQQQQPHQPPNQRNSDHKRNRGRVCWHFSKGSCVYGIKCTFLHPGVNGPPL